MGDAEETIAWSLYVIVFVLLLAGARDVGFWLADKPTLTAYLRAHPGWYFWSVGGFLAFVLALGLHLFVQPLLTSK